MPCNAVATVATKLKIDAGLIIGNEKAITAVKALIAKQLDATQVEATRYTYDNSVLQISAYGWIAHIRSDGRVSVQSRILSRQQLAEVTEKIQHILEEVGGLLLQAKVQALVKAKFQVTEQQRTLQGALVMTLNL